MATHSIFIELAIILLLARFLATAAVRLGVPSVLGELLAGLLLGPTLLGLIEPGEVIRVLAEIGITLLLFEVGLETDMARLVRTGTKSVTVALTGFLLPLLLGFAISFWLFQLPLLISLFVGGTLTATSIGITVRILADLKRQQSREGQIVLGAAVLDDVLGVVLLALLYEFALEGGVNWLSAGRIALFVGAFFVIAPLIAHPVARFIKWLESWGSNVPGVIPTTIIALVLAFGGLASAFGAPDVLGGFAAGLALSRRFFLPWGTILKMDQEFAHRVEAQVKPIIHLLTPIFFVTVGLSVNPGEINLSSPLLAPFVLSILFVAVLGKIIGALLIREQLRKRLIIGTAMVPRGEVGLIFAEMGLRSNAIPETLYAALVIVIVLTTLLPPFVIKAFYRPSCASSTLVKNNTKGEQP